MKYNIPTRDDIKGHFDQLTEDEQEMVNCAFASFYYRTGSRGPDGKPRHKDGSWGEVKITPNEMRDLLAYLMSSV